MLLGILADTHLAGRMLPEEVLDALAGADMILHAGDLVDLSVVEQLSELAPTFAVRGNMDHRDAAAALPESRVIEVGRFRIGITHGYGPPAGILRKVRAAFSEPVDCIVFGHTHQALVEESEEILYFNPGSPTDRMFATERTIGHLRVEDRLVPVIIRLEPGPPAESEGRWSR